MIHKLLIVAALLFISPSVSADLVPRQITELLQIFCVDCHSGESGEGGVVLNLEEIDWARADSVSSWEHVHDRVSRGMMPPPDAPQPNKKQRQHLLNWTHQSLMQHSPIGGTPLRRLNRREYAKTVDRLFNLSGYDVPPSFPPDTLANGFDNQGEALVVAGSHLEAFAEAASQVADQIFPPPAKDVKPSTTKLKPEDLVISYSSACIVNGAMRLASSGTNIVRNATWPSKFEAPASGVYQLQLELSAFNPPDKTPRLTIGTTQMPRGPVTVVHEIDVGGEKPKMFDVEVELHRGNTVVLRYLNGPFDYEDPGAYRTFLKEALSEDPKLAAAWKKVGDPPRGGSGWERVKQAMRDPQLNVAEFIDNEEAVDSLVKQIASDKVASGETLVYRYFEQGPNIAIHSMQLHGPIRKIRSREDIQSEKLQQRFLGEGVDAVDSGSLHDFFLRFLTVAFRRPATQDEVRGFVELVQRETAATGDWKSGMHLAIRTTLLSPAFLYRGFSHGPLDGHELATRLSYFLTSAPPDQTLAKIAQSGRLSSPAVLAKECRRLVGKGFAKEFSSQWLRLAPVAHLMPDTRLGKFSDRHRKTMQAEVVETFWHIWENNLPVTDFIAPDFMFTDSEVGRDIYELPQFKSAKFNKSNKKQRNKILPIEIPRDGRHGGLLSMSGLMMATANGVDTQPVLRGVWVLENILGSPPPPPPDTVPALTPDITSATTVKQRLAAHMTDQSCAVCHREIDPLGFVLENFDPVGRWRTNYPRFEDKDGVSVKKTGASVDAAGKLPDGTPLNDVRDLKRWLVEHPENFARCLAEKLLTFGTGRKMNYRERQIIADIVDSQNVNDLRFQDLLQALVNSQIFRTR